MEAKQLGLNATEFSEKHNISIRYVFVHRAKTERVLGITLPALGTVGGSKRQLPQNNHATYEEGTYVIASDIHYWPGVYSRAEDALAKVLATMHVDCLFLNGDVIDGATVSRHARRMWEWNPSVVEEILEAKARLAELCRVSKNRKMKKRGNYGNHDWRIESYLAANAPSIEGLPGTTFDEIFPDWQWSMSASIGEHVILKHRWHNGVHAAYNNAVKSHTRAMVTGDTHRLQVTRYTAYSGTVYGIESGMLADPQGPQFAYAENNPVNWCPGFVVLRVEDGEPYVEEVDCSRSKPIFRGKPL